DKQIALAVNETSIAGEVPAVPQGLGVGIGPAPVSLEGLIAGQQRDDFALLIGGRNLCRRFGVQPDDPYLLVDSGLAGRAGLGRRVLVDGECVDFRTAVVVEEQLGLECI